MTYSHAAVWMDHHTAQVLQFDADGVATHTVRSHPHDTPQHHSDVRSEHEFFGEVCDALVGIEAVLITGGKTPTSDFRNYVEKHRSPLAAHIAGYEIVDHLTDNQVVALGRKFFATPGQKAPTTP